MQRRRRVSNPTEKALNHELITAGWTIEKSLMNELEYIFDESIVYVGDWDYIILSASKSQCAFCPKSTHILRAT
jgi:hypothetical protein